MKLNINKIKQTMETLQKKFDDDSTEYLAQKIPNSISSKELYCERDLGVKK